MSRLFVWRNNESEKEMKFKEIRNNHYGVISSSVDIIFSVTKEEYDELSKAIKVVDSYTNMARKKSQLNGSDWVETKVKLENEEVVVSITGGMAG